MVRRAKGIMGKCMKTVYVCVLALLVCFLVACGNDPASYGNEDEQIGGSDMDTRDENVFEQNKQKITEHVDAEDIKIIDFMVGQLMAAGVGLIETATLEEADEYGWILLLTDDTGQVYYLELNKYGGIEVLRKDGSRGEVISAVLDD